MRTARATLFQKSVVNLAERLAPASIEDREPVKLQELYIRTKDRRLIQFKPNFVQNQYLDELLPNWREGDTHLHNCRELLLKARQEGLSTLVAALIFLETINVPYTSSAIIAHKNESTEKLFQIIQRYYENLPEDKKLRTKYASKREYYWPEIDSSFYVGTAGERDFGRGLTLNNVHCSEVAFWPDAKKIMTALLESVPAGGNVFLESTANGVGDYFHHEYFLAEEGESRFKARFFPWYIHEEYKDDNATGFTPTGEEIELAARFSLTVPQLAWRREKVKDLRDEFPQEYPATAEEAFISSGNPYFDIEYIRTVETLSSLKVTPPAGALRRLGPQQLEVFKKPQKGHKYAIGADTAEGLTDEGNLDYCSADVVDMDTLEQVAHLHGRWDTHDYGLLLTELGFWYNTALLGIERNNHGHAVLNAVMHSTEYPKMTPANPDMGLYLHREFDERKRMRVRKPGWPTTQKTKYLALDTLATYIDDRELVIRSKGTVRELLSFAKLPGGRAGGVGGAHDDRVISLSIACVLSKLRQRPAVRRQGWIGKTGGWL